MNTRKNLKKHLKKKLIGSTEATSSIVAMFNRQYNTLKTFIFNSIVSCLPVFRALIKSTLAYCHTFSRSNKSNKSFLPNTMGLICNFRNLHFFQLTFPRREGGIYPKRNRKVGRDIFFCFHIRSKYIISIPFFVDLT